MITDSTAWYRLSLGDGITSAMKLDAIREAFELIDRNERVATAIFKHSDSSHGLHCEVTVYFSPGTGELAAKFAATLCRRPSRAGLELLAGNAKVLSTLIDAAT